MADVNPAQKQLQALSDEYQKLQEGKHTVKYHVRQTTSFGRRSLSYLNYIRECIRAHVRLLDLESTVSARQRLEAQEQENLGVQKEFKKLSDNSNVYKLVGPVLLKQDRTEADAAVNGRLEYIGGEM